MGKAKNNKSNSKTKDKVVDKNKIDDKKELLKKNSNLQEEKEKNSNEESKKQDNKKENKKENNKKVNNTKKSKDENVKNSNKKVKLKGFKIEKKEKAAKEHTASVKNAKKSNSKVNTTERIIELSKDNEKRLYNSEYVIYRKDKISKLEEEKKKLEEQNEKIRDYLKEYLKYKVEKQKTEEKEKQEKQDKVQKELELQKSEIRDKKDENFKLSLSRTLEENLKLLEENSTLENKYKKEDAKKIDSNEFDSEDKFRTKIYSWDNVIEEESDKESFEKNNNSNISNSNNKRNVESRRNRRLKEEKRKKKKKGIIRKILILFFTIILIGSATYIGKWLYDNYKIAKLDKENEKILEEAIVEEDHGPKLNIEELRKVNEHSAFLLDFPLFDIKKVVVKGDDNDFYLRRDFKKQYNFAGWVFLDYRNEVSDEEKNFVIYGHNMRDGKTMFSPLLKMLDTNFLKDLKEEDKIIKIQNEKGTDKYKIFSVHEMEDGDIPNINLLPLDDKGLKDFVEDVKKRSIYDFNVDTINPKQTVTLMTCGTTNYDRVMIHAVKIN